MKISMALGMLWYVRYIDALIPFAGALILFLYALGVLKVKSAPGRISAMLSRGRKPLFGALAMVGVAAMFYWQARPPSEVWLSLTGDKFEVLLPNNPTRTVYSSEIPGGIVNIYKWTAGADPDEVTFIVRFSDYPKGYIPADVTVPLRAGIEQLASTTGYKLSNQRSIMVSGYPGVEANFVTGDGGHAKVEIVIAGDRQYVLIRAAAKGQEPVDDRFFPSFKILSK